MWTALAVIAGLMALVNVVQVAIGRQVVRPEASRRSAAQLRRESAAAALAMSGVTLTALHVLWGGFLVVIGYSALLLVRRRARQG